MPGVDFATYRWGNTVDPITPGLIDRPYAARELIPYGTPASADLLAALDRRLQERTLDPGTLAVVARYLGVGDVVLRDDLQFERHRTPRPYDLAPRLGSEPGLDDGVGFGPPVVNDPIPDVPLVDELALLTDDRRPRPPVEVFAVDDAVPIVRTAPAEGGVVLAGDGEGLVDAAAAGLLTGEELLRYGATLGTDGVEAAVDDGAVLVVTDGNRRQGRRWSTVRDILGLVEGAPVLDEDDLTDNRLPLFDDVADADAWQTTAAPVGGVLAAATSYGNPISFTPEYRPANAVDGDLRTEWRTGANTDVRGERLLLTYDPPVPASTATLVQQLTGFRNRAITELAISVDGGEPMVVALDERSLTGEGQPVELPGDGTVTTLELEVRADSSGRVGSWGRPVRYGGLSQIGFAEVRLGDPPAAPPDPESLVLPPAATDAIDEDTPVALVLTRWRTDPTDPVRQDPEPGFARTWSQPVERTWELAGSARLSPRAPDAVLDDALAVTGAVVTTSSRLAGSVVERGSALVDGDSSTWWSPAFDDPEPAITIEPGPRTGGIDHLDLVLVDDPRRSTVTRIRVETDDGDAVSVDVPPGGERVELPRPLFGTTYRVVIEAIDERTSIEWFSNEPVVVPPAIAELGIDDVQAVVPATLDTGCRDDLVAIDGRPLSVHVVGERVASCDGPITLDAGEHTLVAAAGRDTGIDVDRLVLASGIAPDAPVAETSGDAPTVEVVDDGRASVRVRVEGATPGRPFWFVLGQSDNPGWELDGRGSELVNGYAAGWLVTPSTSSFELTAEWRPQRVVNALLAASVLAVIACVVLVVRRPARATSSVAFESTFTRADPSGGRASWVVPVAAGVLSVVWIGPVAAVVVAVAAAVAARWPTARWWLRFGPAVALTGAASYVLARQAIARPTPAFEWPAELETAHQPALVAVALLAVVVALDALDRRQSSSSRR